MPASWGTRIQRHITCFARGPAHDEVNIIYAKLKSVGRLALGSTLRGAGPRARRLTSRGWGRLAFSWVSHGAWNKMQSVAWETSNGRSPL